MGTGDTSRRANIQAAIEELQRLRKKFKVPGSYQLILDLLTAEQMDDGHWNVVTTEDGRKRYMCCNCGHTVNIATRACSICGTFMAYGGSINKRE